MKGLDAYLTNEPNTREWLKEKLAPGVCELSGIRFENGVRGMFKANPFAASVDRIDTTKGYTKDNCRLICFCVNMARSDWGDSVLLRMASALNDKHLK